MNPHLRFSQELPASILHSLFYLSNLENKKIRKNIQMEY